jgi:glycolate oxidase iron-sulfur subunit
LKDDPLDFIRREVSKCVFCGFCEYDCPTLNIKNVRGYGPRGRVRVAKIFIEKDIFSEKSLEYIYTCVLCSACVLSCPAKVDVPGIVVAMRRFIHKKIID